MNWNIYNIIILSASSLIIAVSFFKLLFFERTRTANYLYWFTALANVVIVQVLLIDIGIAQKFPVIQLFYMPFQFLSPVLFTAFTFSYLNQMNIFKKYRIVLLLPFTLFFVLYTFLKINIISDYAYLSKEAAAYIGYEWDENLAVSFSLLMGIWNYKSIRDYEKSFGNLPYKIVMRKTVWLKRIYFSLVVLSLLWVSIIAFIKVGGISYGHLPYYPLWFLFLVFYFCFCFLGTKHLKEVRRRKEQEKITLKKVAHSFQLSGLNKVFSSEELEAVQGSQHETTAILSYFATSLFDKNNTEDVLWDIAGNCIAKLNLEDCVIYSLDKERNILVQKAAYGNKLKGKRKILSPLEIPVGEGIVGAVAQNRRPELVDDLSSDLRYILDDIPRKSELAVPIIFEGQLFGVLDSEHSKKGFFQERHLFLFQLIAKLTATKLQQITDKVSTMLTNDNAYYKELNRLLQKEKIYRDADLSLTSAAERLNISSTYLSQLVNTVSGQNFSDLINCHRIREAEYMLTNPDFSRYTILGIGLEAGFNSKSAFYSSFKKHTGITPSQYRKNRLVLS